LKHGGNACGAGAHEGAFRGIDAAASLKPDIPSGVDDTPLVIFPRHRCRGLIEAGKTNEA